MILKKISSLFVVCVFFLGYFLNSSWSQSLSTKDFKNSNAVIDADYLINFTTAYSNQRSLFEGNRLSNSAPNPIDSDTFVGNDTQIYLKTGLKTQNQAIYGAIAKLEFNFNSNKNNQNPNLDQAFIFAKNNWGKFELGNIWAANQTLKVGPAKFARGAGGINGKYLENVNLPIVSNSTDNVKLPRFILLAQSPVGHGGYAKSFYSNSMSTNQNNLNDFANSNFRALKDNSFDGLEDATKISYYSPRIKGFKLGVSYSPDSSDNGITSTKYFNLDDVRLKNIFSFGLNYLEYFDNLKLEMGATLEKAKMQNSTNLNNVQRSNLLAYDLGIIVSYFGFDLGASWGTWRDSLQYKNGLYSCDYDSNINLEDQDCSNNATGFDDPQYYSLGIAYSFGPIAASITSINSSFNQNDYRALSIGLDYKLKRDFIPYIELTKFDFKSNQIRALNLNQQSSIIQDNAGYVLLTGFLINF